jgi:predicted transposase YbfD/YdcC
VDSPLEDGILQAFADVDDGKVAPAGYESRDARHGREEIRICEVLPVPADLRNAEGWKDLRCICRVTRRYRERHDDKSEVRYFISSLRASAKVLAQAIRGHWGVENGLHWVLDRYFGEDRSRARTDHAAANLAMLRRWVLSMLRQNATVDGSIEKKRQQAAWTDQTREQILGLSIEN